MFDIKKPQKMFNDEKSGASKKRKKERRKGNKDSLLR